MCLRICHAHLRLSVAVQDEEITVGQRDFEAALAALQPSLSPEDLRRYEAMKDSYQQLPKRPQ
jgi:SpoVK/Ycf46/Vps4 family AAA+-type ATPase